MEARKLEDVVDSRRSSNVTLRSLLAIVQRAGDAIRKEWPERYPVPPEVDATLELEEQLLRDARDGKLTAVQALERIKAGKNILKESITDTIFV